MLAVQCFHDIALNEGADRINGLVHQLDRVTNILRFGDEFLQRGVEFLKRTNNVSGIHRVPPAALHRDQGDTGRLLHTAVPHSSTPVERRVTAALDRLEQAEQAADKARQKVLKEGVA